MNQIRTINLEGRIRGGAAIEFVQAEVPLGRRSPLALVRYRDQGRMSELGLRLDMDKRVFVDHFEDGDKEAVVQNAAHAIVRVVGSVLFPANEVVGEMNDSEDESQEYGSGEEARGQARDFGRWRRRDP